MPRYKETLDGIKTEFGQSAESKVCAGILKIRGELKKQKVPPRNLDRTLLLATWNIREFGSSKPKFGRRTQESLLYLAEIISHFDLVAIQEINQNLRDLKALMHLLGEWWDFIVTDVTDGRSGNEERIAFLFDGRKVRFDHVAGEVVFPADKRKPVLQAARSPFLCTFKAGWRRFSLCSVHIFYGKANPNDPRRVAEIGRLAQLLAERNRRRAKSPDGEPDNVILLGDFNIFNKSGDKTSQALEEAGFRIPKEITKLPTGSNVARDKYYDQIAYLVPSRNLRTTAQAGVFNFLTAVYGDQYHSAYGREMAATDTKYRAAKDKQVYFRKWRTFQISDHLPLWLELEIDYSRGYLAKRGQFNRGRQKSDRVESSDAPDPALDPAK